MFSSLDVSGLTQGVTAVCPALDDSQGAASDRSEASFATSSRTSIDANVGQMQFYQRMPEYQFSKSEILEEDHVDVENTTPPDPNSTPSTGGSSAMIRRAVEHWKYNLKYCNSGVQFECSECQSTYKHKKSLNKHWKDKHPGLIRQTSACTTPGFSSSSNTPARTPLGSQSSGSQQPQHYQQGHIPVSASLKRLRCDFSDTESSPPGSLPSKRPHLSAFNRCDMNTSLPLTPLRAPVTLPPVAHIIRRPLATIPVPGSQFIPHHPHSPPPPPLPPLPPLPPQLIPPVMSQSPVMLLTSNSLLSDRAPASLVSSTVATVSSVLDLSLSKVGEQPLDLTVRQSVISNPEGFSSRSSISSASNRQEIYPSILPESSSNTEALNLSVHSSHPVQPSMPPPPPTSAFTTPVYQTPPRTTNLPKCHQCHNIFSSSDSLNHHFNECHKGVLQAEKEKVDKWKTVFQMSSTELENCRRTDQSENGHGIIVYQCPLCEFNSRWPTEFQRHFSKHRRDKPCECCVCGQSYKWHWDLGRHFKKQHSGLSVNPYKRFLNHNEKTSSSLSTTAAPAPAPAIMKTVPSSFVKQSMASTMKTESSSEPCPTSPPELQLMCPRCQYRARWPSELRSHMVNHSGHRAYGCRFCGYRAKWKWDVAKHLKRCREAVGKVMLPAGNDYLVQFVNYIRPPAGDILLDYVDEESGETSTGSSNVYCSEQPQLSQNTIKAVRSVTCSEQSQSSQDTVKSEESESDNKDKSLSLKLSTAETLIEKTSVVDSPEDSSERGNLVIDESIKGGVLTQSLTASGTVIRETPPLLIDICSKVERGESEINTKVEAKWESDVDSDDRKPPILTAEAPQQETVISTPDESLSSSATLKSVERPIKITIKRCPFCDFMSGNPKELQEHVQSHTFPSD